MCFVYRGGKGSSANQAWSGKNMILMEHEWSVRDVCFLFCLDYPKVIFFSSVSFALGPPVRPSNPCFFPPPFNYRPHEETRELQELGVNRRVALGGFTWCLTSARRTRERYRPRDWRAQKEIHTFSWGGKVLQIECRGGGGSSNGGMSGARWPPRQIGAQVFRLYYRHRDKYKSWSRDARITLLDGCDSPSPSLTVNGGMWKLFKQSQTWIFPLILMF